MFDATLVPVRRALISVSDKTGLVDFAHGLDALGINRATLRKKLHQYGLAD